MFNQKLEMMDGDMMNRGMMGQGMMGQGMMGGPMTIGLMIILGLGMIFLYFYFAIWIYRDAHKRGMEAAVWLLIYFVTSVVGLFIYLIVRKDTPVRTRLTTTEPTVQVRVVPTIIQEDKFCNQCGTKLATDAKFCNSCGAKQ